MNRYEKQQMCTFIGEKGQQQLAQKHVLIVGVGALGSSSAEALVRAGVGTLTIIDRDYVQLSNLQRQQLYCESDAEQFLPKAVAAKRRLQAINKHVTIHEYIADANVELLTELIQDVDVILDGTDNFDTRFVLNDLAQCYDVPYVFAACVGSFGSTYTIIPKKTPCLHCLLQSIPLTGTSCDAQGVIQPIIQLITSYQVTECLKLLVGETALRETYVSADIWRAEHLQIGVEFARKEQCPSCGEQATFPYLQQEQQMKAAVLCGRQTVQLRLPKEHSFSQMTQLLQAKGAIQKNKHIVVIEQQPYRLVFFKDGRVLIHGTDEVNVAKKLFYQLVG